MWHRLGQGPHVTALRRQNIQTWGLWRARRFLAGLPHPWRLPCPEHWVPLLQSHMVISACMDLLLCSLFLACAVLTLAAHAALACVNIMGGS